jgi:hypothetical protein
MQQASMGRIVIVPVNPQDPGTNGQTEAPAMITGIFEQPDGRTLVNLRVMLDGPELEWRTSQELLDERPDDAVKYAVQAGVAWWPPRTPTTAAM